mgnify:CR=1 FL=1
MDLITLDFETFYDKDFSLRKITLENYIRDPRFEIVGVGIKVNNGDTEWASGTHEELHDYLHTFDWKNSMVLAHNTMFDGAILGWLFNIRPRIWADTLCIARALHGVEVGGSLAVLAERYRIGEKGTEVLDAMGLRRLDFSEEQLDSYGDYCINDVELTYKLFALMGKNFPKKEMRIVDMTLRMFIEPVLELDLPLLETHLVNVKQRKLDLIESSGVTKTDLMSNPKFAKLLEAQGVTPPKKISLTTGKETHAFAKSDEAFKELLDHENPAVVALVESRLGVKSSLEESRTERFIGIAKRGLLPVPVRYYAAHTGRWGGDDKINIQNLPSRGVNGKVLKKSIVAPEGYVLIDCDSSQIEARVLAWLAGQDDLVQAFLNKEDVYIKMAARIYDIPESEVTAEQRFVGKTTILGAGYGMGAVRFAEQLKTFGTTMAPAEAKRVVQIYRESNWKIAQLWRTAQHMLVAMSRGDNFTFGANGIVECKARNGTAGIRLPSGLWMKYADLQFEQGERGPEFSYMTRRGRTRIYGGKVVENICQAIARCIMGEQMLAIARKHKIALTVHDSVVCCVEISVEVEAREYIEACMNTTPAWADGLPIACESGTGKSYGEAG